MSDRKIQNAIIKNAELTIENHGLLTSWLSLDYGQYGIQSFGGYCLYNLISTPRNLHSGGAYAGMFIVRILEIAGVGKWSDLVGKTIRVDAEHSKCHGIGHIVKDEWFYPKKEFAK